MKKWTISVDERSTLDEIHYSLDRIHVLFRGENSFSLDFINELLYNFIEILETRFIL